MSDNIDRAQPLREGDQHIIDQAVKLIPLYLDEMEDEPHLSVAAMSSAPAYLSRLPSTIPGDLVLVHNNVRPTRRLGARGFRVWLSPPSDQLSACACGWAPES
jgi:hypothetical protein